MTEKESERKKSSLMRNLEIEKRMYQKGPEKTIKQLIDLVLKIMT
jgi:hypothetical protein